MSFTSLNKNKNKKVRIAAIAFLAGIVLLQQLPELPGSRWAGLLLISLPLSVWFRPLKIPLWMVNGFLLALLQANAILATSLPAELEGQDLVIEGVIDSLPEQRQYGQRFVFKPEKAINPELPREILPAKIRLNWYRTHEKPQVGQRWQLKVRLKHAHGFMNPGGFDYEGWLFRHGIRATGYVRKAEENRYISQEGGFGYWLDAKRARLAQQIDQALPDSQFKGMIQALAIGLRQQISDEQWDVLVKTGTNHLMAISGLHVGLVAGLAFFLLSWCWRRSVRLLHLYPASKAGALAAIVAALVYAALAGFSVPTQRALTMVVVFMLALLWQRHRRPSDGLLLALLIVLALDPLAVMDAGFWLSFAAVAIILFGLGGRMGGQKGWSKWGKIHLLIAIGLLPLTLLLFQKASLISPLANLVAVPLVSLLVVPLVLLGTLSLAVIPMVGQALLQLADLCLQLLWPLLEWLAQLPAAQIYQAFVSGWVIIPLCIGIAWLLAPRGWPARWLGGVWLLCAFCLPHDRPEQGEAQFILLDVGQGLAAVVETQNKILVFDTGPKFSSSFDTGEAVVLPYLISRGLDRIDTLIVSHGDNDHIGGAESLMQSMPVTTLLTSAPNELAHHNAKQCQAGQRWHWDGVLFELLHPDARFDQDENNNSCVLKVTTAAGALLLTGDIEKQAERYLSKTRRAELQADVLVVPHHGSKTSSTDDFIQAVGPRWALFPVGYRNRFKLPRQVVVDRYDQVGAEAWASGWHGAISMRFDEAQISAPEGYRALNRRYWTHFPKQPLVVTEK